jgi:RsiW-degrading membrane proteinase PrsW (M82 family)
MNVDLGLFISFFGIFFLYSLILYLAAPRKTITLKEIYTSVLAGVLSITILQFTYAVFPNQIQGDFHEFMYVVAPREELSKFIMFLLATKWISKKRKIKPVGYMIISCAVALGFALEENMHYYLKYGEHVLSVRNVSAMPAHMFFGGIMGYWYAVGKLNIGKFGRRINLGQWFIKSRLTIYSTIGLFCASLLHGIWNYSLSFYAKILNMMMDSVPKVLTLPTFTTGWLPITLLIVFILLFLMRILYRDLIRLEKEKQDYINE